jgi:hypothetical protein
VDGTEPCCSCCCCCCCCCCMWPESKQHVLIPATCIYPANREVWHMNNHEIPLLT